MTTTSVIDAGPVPVTGHEAEVKDYCSPPLREWIIRLRAELTPDEIAAELWRANAFLGDLRRSLVRLDHARSHPGRIGRTQRMAFYKEAVRADCSQTMLAKEFDVNKGTISRWLSGQRDPPRPFLTRLEDLESERYTRAGVRVDCLWLALCDNPVDDPETVDLRLVQLYEFGTEEDVTPEGLLHLAGPLTTQAMARIHEALNTPIGDLLAQG